MQNYTNTVRRFLHVEKGFSLGVRAVKGVCRESAHVYMLLTNELIELFDVETEYADVETLCFNMCMLC
ncbi:MAG: hypothetical protein D3906_04875 [Candidatus Electrothrix sp. AUS1_2]|nr:hypothetical protein [Candidatus Electrothrix sp. AUS1_2]